MGCAPPDAECTMEQLTEGYRTLHKIRHTPDSASPTGSSVAKLLGTLDSLAKLRVSVRLLAASGIGREVNHPFVRWHASPKVREASQALVRSWKELVRGAAAGGEEPSSGSKKRKMPGREAVGCKRGQQPRPAVPEPCASEAATSSTCRQNERPQTPAGTAQSAPEERPQPPAEAGREPHADTGSDSQGEEQPQTPPVDAECDPRARLGRCTVKELKMRLAEMQVDHAGCIEKSDLISLLLAAGPDAAAPREPATPPRCSRRDSCSQWTVPELKAKMKEMGLSADACTEKADLIAALRRAPAPLRRSGPAEKQSPRPKAPRTPAKPAPARVPMSPSPRVKCGGFAKRISMGRKSLLRSKPEQHQTPAARERALGQKKELRRIERAADDLGVLGLKRRELERMTVSACREAVMQSYRKLCRVVHPDKCPAELRESATRAFQRLERAREAQLSSVLLL